MYGYVYKTTNLINNKIYIGKHKAQNFNPNYKGSGKVLHRAIDKYGLENFSTELIEVCEEKESLNSREKYWILSLRSQDQNIGYNISDGGDGGDNIHCLPIEDQKRIRSNHSKWMSENNPSKNPETLKKMIEWRIGRKRSEETKAKISKAISKPHILSEEWHRKAHLNRLGKFWINNGIEEKQVKDVSEIPNGYELGRIFKHRNRKSRYATTIESYKSIRA